MGTSFFLWTGWLAFTPVFPLHVDDLGFSFFDLGLLMVLPSFFSIFLRLPIGTVAGQIGKKDNSLCSSHSIGVISASGLFLLRFIFYFLDPCIAPIFVSIMPLLLPETFLFTLFVFCLGAIVPFIGIGVFAGSISKLARSTYRYRSKIRAISGLILIGYPYALLFLSLLHIIK